MALINFRRNAAASSSLADRMCHGVNQVRGWLNWFSWTRSLFWRYCSCHSRLRSCVSEAKAAGIHYRCVLTDNESKPAAAQNKHSCPSVSEELTDVSASKNENNRLRQLRLRRAEPLSVWRVKSTPTLIAQPSVAHHPHSKCPAVTSPLDWQTVRLDWTNIICLSLFIKI